MYAIIATAVPQKAENVFKSLKENPDASQFCS